ncbi:PilC/PilY family type IV pilus protein [Psychrobacter immobilis]|uniref:PilC/PilY family type IV pilus protein n=1 Tax=Psychrobacter immobilis TaxID=498 RepID=UPI00191B20C5|nr:PilC/PilY family type IV pilus protein [Psychrobacter immobilis]
MKISTLSPVQLCCTPRAIFKVSALAVALSAINILATTTEAAVSYSGSGTASYSTIGDLSIYQPPVGETKPTIMLMLDKSGSMGNFYRNNYGRIDSLWVDYGSLDYQKRPYTITEYIDRVEREYICTRYGFFGCKDGYWKETTVTDTVKTKYDYHTPNLKGNNNQPCYYSDYDKNTVNSYISPPNGAVGNGYPSGFKDNYISASRLDDGYNYNITYCIDTSVQDTRTAAEKLTNDIPTNWRLDRISVLKVAVFKLLRNPKMNDNISIGAGSYGHDGGKYGKIGVSAKPLNNVQKNKLRQYIADLDPYGGTPIARALAEAGAYVLGNNTTAGTSNYSGFLNTANDSDIRNATDYIKPDSSQCAGTGIYMLTDGQPNNGSQYTQTMMRPSLNNSSFQCSSSSMNNTNAASGDEARWDCIGEYAKALNNKGIKTAMVGFGSDFNVFDDVRNYKSIQSTLSDGTPYEKKYYRCDLLTNKDAQNSCNLGMESSDDKTGFTGYTSVGGFGEGGFYYAKDSKDIVNSVLSFVTKLDNDLASIPSGTITIPQDPLSAQNIQPYAYLPMLEPKVGSNLLVWPGNLKKYEVNQGTLYGKSATGSNADTRLYVNIDQTKKNKDGRDTNGKDTTGKKFPTDLNPNARDLWSTKNSQTVDKDGNTVNANDRITAGGFYARLKSPSAANNSTRAVYVESGVGLKKVAVTAGALVGFGDLDGDYGAKEKLYLLSFLGYDININQDLIDKVTAADNQETELAKLITSPNGEVKVLGGVLHSAPTLVSYGGKINSPEKDSNNDDIIDADAGQISTDDSDRDDYVMFGSMEGALHLAKSETGEEALAFIPKTFIKNKLKALKNNAVNIDTAVQPPVFGVDAPWTSAGKYKYTFNTDSSGKVIATAMKIYGGLGKGGVGLYGLDVGTINNLTPNPSKLFTINDTTDGYSRMGMVMVKPVVGKIKIGTGSKATKDVIIFGGGYDKCYEDPTFKLNSTTNNISGCSNIAQAKGNAVYIADASTGALIASVSGSTTGTKNVNVSSMKHSIVSEITTLDRDNDGLIDHLYFGDLGGQVYRVDLQNGQTLGSTAGLNTFVRRVTRVLNTSGDTTSDAKSKALLNKGLQYRFYTQPSVSFFKSADTNGKRIAIVNIASGDRSSPLSRQRDDLTEANRIFGIIDRDITDQNLYGDTIALSATELTLDKLASLPFDKVTTPTGTTPAVTKTKSGVIAAMKSGVFQGWSYPLTYFDGYSNIKHVKSVGTGLALGGIYYMTAYSPEMQYDTTVNTCSAQVVGGSERQLYCLPWGICEAEASKNGIGGFVRAGKGIQELALGAASKDATNVQVLVGNQTFSEQTVDKNRSGYGNRAFDDTKPNILPHTTNGSGTPKDTDGMGTAGIFGNMSGYVLNPQRWYQKSPD